MGSVAQTLRALWTRHKADLGLVILLAYVLALAFATANEIVEMSRPFTMAP